MPHEFSFNQRSKMDGAVRTPDHLEPKRISITTRADDRHDIYGKRQETELDFAIHLPVNLHIRPSQVRIKSPDVTIHSIAVTADGASYVDILNQSRYAPGDVSHTFS